MRTRGKTPADERLTVEVRKELAAIHIYRMRGQDIEPSDKEIAKRYLLTVEEAREVLNMTPKAAEPFPLPDSIRWP